MKINPNVANVTQKTYSNNNFSNESVENNKTKGTTKEAISLNISSAKEGINNEDLSSIQNIIKERSTQLGIDYKNESENFSKNNVSFFEGSFLSSQSSKIEESATKLLTI